MRGKSGTLVTLTVQVDEKYTFPSRGLIERGCRTSEQDPSAEIRMFRKSKSQLELEFTHAIQQDYTRLFVTSRRALTSTLELEIVLTTVMTKMAQFFGPERWSMMLVDKEKNDLYYVIAVGEDTNSLRGMRVPMGEGIAGWVALTGNPMVVPDTTVEPRWQEFSRQNPGLNIHSIACMPVRSAEGVVGVIQLLNSKIDLLSDYSIQFLRVLCDFSAIAVRNAEDMKRIHMLSITDDCSGLFNARHLYTLLAEQLARPASRRSACCFWTWTASRASTTRMVTWSAAACWQRWAR